MKGIKKIFVATFGGLLIVGISVFAGNAEIRSTSEVEPESTTVAATSSMVDWHDGTGEWEGPFDYDGTEYGMSNFRGPIGGLMPEFESNGDLKQDGGVLVLMKSRKLLAIDPDSLDMITADTEIYDPPTRDNQDVIAVYKTVHCSSCTLLPNGEMLFVGQGGSEKSTDGCWVRGPQAATIVSVALGGASVEAVQIEDFPNVTHHVDVTRRYPTAITIPNGNVWVFGGSYWKYENPIIDCPVGNEHGFGGTRPAADGDSYDAIEYDTANDEWWTNRTSGYGGLGAVSLESDTEDQFYNLPDIFIMPSGMIWAAPQRQAYLYPRDGDDIPLFEITPDEIGGLRPGNRSSHGFTLMYPLRNNDEESDLLDRIMVIGGYRDYLCQLSDKLYVLYNTGSAWAWDDDDTDGPIDNFTLGSERLHPSAVLLPDGSIFVTGGHDGTGIGGCGHGDPYGPEGLNAVTTPELIVYDYDVEEYTGTNDLAVVPSTSGPGRLWYTSSMLLPDGRVFVTGMGETDPSETFDIYSPEYLDDDDPPTLTSVPDIINYDPDELDRYKITGHVDDSRTIDRVTLLRPGTVNHDVDTSQRVIDLEITSNGLVTYGPSLGPSSTFTLFVRPPIDGFVAPPGYYLLWVIDSDGIPCARAQWVEIAEE